MQGLHKCKVCQDSYQSKVLEKRLYKLSFLFPMNFKIRKDVVNHHLVWAAAHNAWLKMCYNAFRVHNVNSIKSEHQNQIPYLLSITIVLFPTLWRIPSNSIPMHMRQSSPTASTISSLFWWRSGFKVISVIIQPFACSYYKYSSNTYGTKLCYFFRRMMNEIRLNTTIQI